MTATVIPFRTRAAIELQAGGVLALAGDLFTYYLLCALWGALEGIKFILAVLGAP